MASERSRSVGIQVSAHNAHLVLGGCGLVSKLDLIEVAHEIKDGKEQLARV
jgi:hypothetical protein